MGVIENFKKQYGKEYEFYKELSNIAHDILESEIINRGIKAIVSHRAKRVDRLKEKLEKRNKKKNYKSKRAIEKGIVDLAGIRVALYFPPPLTNFAPERPANWEDFIFGRHMPEKLYAAFFASMFGLLFSRRSDNDRGLRIENLDDRRGYSIVTLNYDLLPERFEQLLAKYFAGGETMHFQRDRYDETDHLPHLAKIHGSSDSKDIIPLSLSGQSGILCY